MPNLKLVPDYEVTVERDPDDGKLVITPKFRQGSYVAFKIWHQRALNFAAAAGLLPKGDKLDTLSETSASDLED